MEEGNRSILTSEEKEEEQNNTRMTRWIPEDQVGILQKNMASY